jgi:hypothetical protein
MWRDIDWPGDFHFCPHLYSSFLPISSAETRFPAGIGPAPNPDLNLFTAYSGGKLKSIT